MNAAILHREPVGIVVRDGGDMHMPPRILMWHWAVEEETPEDER